MARVTVSFSGTEESSERCKQLFPEGKNETALTALLDAFESKEKSSTDLAETKEQLKTTQNELNQLKEDLDPYREIVNSLCEFYNVDVESVLSTATTITETKLKYQKRIVDLEEQLKTAQDEARRFGTENGILKTQINENTLAENQLLLTLPDAVLKMLQLTAERLTEKYQVEITPQDVLMKIFVRYTVERYTNWFYNFVLSDGDIEACSGKSIAEWKAFIKGELK